MAAEASTGLDAPAPDEVGARSGRRARRRTAASHPPAPVAAVRTTRVAVDKVDPWSVLKLSLLFYLSLCIVLLTAGVLLWAAAQSVGVIGNIESFMDGIGFTNFTFEGGKLLRGFALGGLVLVVAGTFGNVLMAVLYNLIADLVGGLRLTLTDDDPGGRRRKV